MLLSQNRRCSTRPAQIVQQRRAVLVTLGIHVQCLLFASSLGIGFCCPNLCEHVLLLHKPSVTRFLTLAAPRSQELKTVAPDKLRNKFRHLQNRDVLPNASPCTGPEWHITSLHALQLIRGSDLGVPSILIECRWVIENIGIVMRHPYIHSNHSLFGVASAQQHGFVITGLSLPTPGGKNVFAIVAPPASTTRHIGGPVEGWILRASLRTLWRQGKFCASS